MSLIRIKKANLLFQWRTLCDYYPKNWHFAFSDLLFAMISFFSNPYRVARKHGCIYGETPIPTLHHIANLCSLSASDCWLDLGSGRGKGCFWIVHFYGCKTIGVDHIAFFIRCARWVRALSKTKNLFFLCADILEIDFSQATCVYLYGTCMSEEKIASIVEAMKALPIHAKVVTVSAPLPENSRFQMIQSFSLSFPWGDTNGYLHTKISHL